VSRRFDKWESPKHVSRKRRGTVPAKLSKSWPHDQYFHTILETEIFISKLGEREEHGKQSVSSEDRQGIPVSQWKK
jgi:hypothetical protein